MVTSFRRPIRRILLICLYVFVFATGAPAALANTPPPESTSKVKKVLLYNQIGGWVAIEGIAEVKKYMAKLALAKGFVLDTLSNDRAITLENLKQYQVIVWNNNSNGAASVPTSSAREAIVEYVNQGGGWFLIGLAGYHVNSWPALTEMMGAGFTRWSSSGVAIMQVDSSALSHPELRFVVLSAPQSIRLNETWMAFDRTVRPLPGVTVLYTAKSVTSGVVPPMGDDSDDHTYVWARTIQAGKLLYCAAGWGNTSTRPLAQSDSAVAKLYWNSMRWLAGDFQNGCTDPRSSNFDPGARVDDGTCITGNLRIESRMVRKGGTRQIRHSLTPLIPDAEGLQNRDIRGKWIYEPQSNLPK